MTPDQVKRKLAAILSADVKGYSRLMGEDEEWTIHTLKVYMEVITGFIQQHHGRTVGTAGDSVLAEFASVVDAVRCAVGIQEELKERNKDLEENRRMEFRIGVNLGDVVEEGDNILGDGVNIAARVQSLAEAGGICITGTAYDHIKNKLALGYESVGEQTVKNIKEPVKIYRVLMEPGIKVPEVPPSPLPEEKKPVRKGLSRAILAGIALVVIASAAVLYQFALRPSTPKIEVASKEKMAFPLPNKPSIAVLPFINIGGDKEQEYFCDGLTEGIIDALSKSENVFVIARTSTFTYKSKPVKVKQIAEEMGVRYVMEGSVQREGKRVRITAQFIDALTGHHLFSERYDRDFKNILTLQDEITLRVLTALNMKLFFGVEAKDLIGKGPKNLEAGIKLTQASRYLFGALNKERLEKARQLIDEAIVLDPNYASAYSYLCLYYQAKIVIGASEIPKEDLLRALALGKKAVTLDDSSPEAHTTLSSVYTFLGEHDKATAEAEKAISISPNSALACWTLGSALNLAGRFQEAIPYIQKSLRLGPIPISGQLLNALAYAYYNLNRYEEAIATLKQFIRLYGPDDIASHIGLAYCYMQTNRLKEARAEAAEIMRIDPRFVTERYVRGHPLGTQTMKDNWIAVLRKAGLK